LRNLAVLIINGLNVLAQRSRPVTDPSRLVSLVANSAGRMTRGARCAWRST